jgi:signal peptidase I
MTRLLILVVAAALGIGGACVLRVTRVSSNSMHPLLRDGQHVLLWRARWLPWAAESARLPSIARGDVIVLRAPFGDKLLVKRVVALGGDTVRIQEGLLFLNGKLVYEPFVRHANAVLREHDRWPMSVGATPMTIPPGSLFVLGDNRSESTDSRVWGPLSMSSVVARVSLPLPL